MEFNLEELGIELPEDKAVALKTALSTLIDSEVSGLRGKNAELLGKVKTSQSDLVAFKAQFDGLDVERLKAVAAQAGKDEESRLIAEGKYDELVGKKTERMRADYDKQLSAARAEVEQAQSIRKRYEDKVLADSIKSGAMAAQGLTSALEDFVYRARGVFQLGENGEAVAVTADGDTVFGKDGKTPLSPAEWAESLKEVAPHLFARAQGAGQTGDRGGKATMKRSEMTPVQIHAYTQKYGRQDFLKLPK